MLLSSRQHFLPHRRIASFAHPLPLVYGTGVLLKLTTLLLLASAGLLFWSSTMSRSHVIVSVCIAIGLFCLLGSILLVCSRFFLWTWTFPVFSTLFPFSSPFNFVSKKAWLSAIFHLFSPFFSKCYGVLTLAGYRAMLKRVSRGLERGKGKAGRGVTESHRP